VPLKGDADEWVASRQASRSGTACRAPTEEPTEGKCAGGTKGDGFVALTIFQSAITGRGRRFLNFSGTGFSLSSCVHRVRCRAEAKIGRIAM
jgi:hypothetical protein